jgi:prevent-host-death family protein
MIKRCSISEARANFTSVVHEAESGTQVELTRRSKPVAVPVGVEDFERPSKGRPNFWEAYEEFRRAFSSNPDLDPDEIFGDVRDPSLGPDFDW